MKDLIKLRKEELQNLKIEKASLIESTNSKEEIRTEREAEMKIPERRKPLVEDQGKHEEERAPNDDIRIEDLEVPKDQVDAKPPMVSSKAFRHIEQSRAILVLKRNVCCLILLLLHVVFIRTRLMVEMISSRNLPLL